MDDVEERRQSIDVEQLASQCCCEIETEAVDPHLGRPVPERVHDQFQDLWMHHVQGVPGPGEVHVVARVFRHRPVVGRVVDAAVADRRPEVVALAGVVVDDVDDDLDACGVERLDHLFELGDLLAPDPRRRVLGVGREVVDRVVAPEVPQPFVEEELRVDELMRRHDLDRGDSKHLEVFDRCGMCEPRVGATEFGGDARDG